MKVLQITDAYGPYGGTERFVYEFSEQLLERGDATVIAAHMIEAQSGWGQTPIETVSLAGRSEDWADYAERYAPDLVVWHSTPKTAGIVRKLARRYKIVSFVHGAVCPSGGRLFRDRDEICMRTGGLGCLPRWYARRCGTQISPVVALEALRDHAETVKTLRISDKVYAVSYAVRHILIQEGVPQHVIGVFDNSLGLLNHTAPLQPPDHTRPFRLLFVGRLVYQKGVQYLLQAVHYLKAEGRQFECDIVGEGWYRPKLERLAEQFDIGDKIRFVGQVPGAEIKRWYEKADLVVVPSIWPEPAGLVVPEARNAGKRVIAFDAGGLSEWGGERDGIHIVKHADCRQLADKISELMEEGCAAETAIRPPIAASSAYPRLNPLEDILSIL